MIGFMDKLKKINFSSVVSLDLGVEGVCVSHKDKSAYINAGIVAVLLMTESERKKWVRRYIAARDRAQNGGSTTLEEVRQILREEQLIAAHDASALRDTAAQALAQVPDQTASQQLKPETSGRRRG